MIANNKLTIVHESEAQRQHARVRLPATFEFSDDKKVFKVHELSASGLSLENNSLTLKMGQMETGLLQFNMEGLLIGLQLTLQVKNIDAVNGRIGCVFQEMGQQEINTLRHMITSYLAGELITAGDVISTLQRDNFTKARKKESNATEEHFYGKARALAGSVFVFLLGLSAFSFIGSTLYNLYFVSNAKSAFVDVASINVTLPRTGTLQSLVPEDGRVVKGAPIASFSSSMLDVLKGHLDANALQGGQIERLIGTTLKGTITSPCDCTVVKQVIADDQTANKGDVAFILVPNEEQAHISARFSYNNLDKLQPGKNVVLSITGNSQQQKGTIRTAMVDPKNPQEIIVTIDAESKLDASFAQRPVHVSIGSPINIHLFDRIHAIMRPEA
jgi:alginate biosynthesis protein Alg44